MSLAIAFLLLSAQAGPFAQSTNLSVFYNSARVGSAVMTRQIATDGRLITGVAMTLRSGSQTVTVTQQSEYDEAGYPKSKLQKRNASGASESITVTFNGPVATVVTESKGSTRQFRVTAPTGAEIRALSEFWFIKTPPTIGEKYSYYRFDMTLQRWTKTTVECLRKEEITVAGKTLNAFFVDHGDLRGWSDEKGRPLRLISGNLKFEWTGE